MTEAATDRGPNDSAIIEAPASFDSGGQPITVEGFRPAGPGPFPAVLILHGADGLTRHGAAYRTGARGLARRGYLALLAHYLMRTGSDTAGPPFNPLRFVAWLGTVGDAVMYAAEHPDARPGGIGLLGFSLGSYLGMAYAASDERVVAAVDCFGGIHDLMAGTVTRLPPTLILHGDADHVVPVREAHKLESILRRVGAPHETHIYPGVGHGFHGPTADDALARLAAFFDKYLKSRAQQAAAG